MHVPKLCVLCARTLGCRGKVARGSSFTDSFIKRERERERERESEKGRNGERARGGGIEGQQGQREVWVQSMSGILGWSKKAQLCRLDMSEGTTWYSGCRSNLCREHPD